MDTTTPKRAFASPIIDIYPLGSVTYSPGRFSPFKTDSPQHFPPEGICIIVWDGFRRLKRISRNITLWLVIMPLTGIESGLSAGGAAMCMEEKATAPHIEAPHTLG